MDIIIKGLLFITKIPSKLLIVGTICPLITAVLVPEVRILAFSTIANIFIVNSIDLIQKRFDKNRSNTFLSVINILSKIILLKYTSENFEELSKISNYGGYIIHAFLCDIYSILSKTTYYSFFFGSIFSSTIAVLSPLLMHRFNRIILITESTAELFLRRLQTGEFNLNFNGVAVSGNSSRSIIDEKTLEEKCPLRCSGLNNSEREKLKGYTIPEKCAICTDEYSQKQLTRTLPCLHSFHATCVDPWVLTRSADCPICRQKIISN